MNLYDSFMFLLQQILSYFQTSLCDYLLYLQMLRI